MLSTCFFSCETEKKVYFIFVLSVDENDRRKKREQMCKKKHLRKIGHSLANDLLPMALFNLYISNNKKRTRNLFMRICDFFKENLSGSHTNNGLASYECHLSCFSFYYGTSKKPWNLKILIVALIFKLSLFSA